VDDTFDVTLRTAVYRHFATTGQSPTLARIGLTDSFWDPQADQF